MNLYRVTMRSKWGSCYGETYHVKAADAAHALNAAYKKYPRVLGDEKCGNMTILKLELVEEGV